ncbi:hypothetical protein ABK040_004705 [Willaertia magna]
MRKLDCAVQYYNWGKKGEDSTVGQIHKVQQEDLYHSNFKLSNDEYYAELWMGTHPNGPTKIVLSSSSTSSDNDNYNTNNSTILLDEFLRNNKHYFSEKEVKEFDISKGQLPYLFKVLSVNQALSIQAHPDKNLAKYLFETDREHYKDDNHKPEVCIALTKFEALCAFQKLENIIYSILNVKELFNLINDQNSKIIIRIKELHENNLINKLTREERKEIIKECFSTLMNTKQVEKYLTPLIQRLKQEQELKPHEDLLLRLFKDYPNDIGCFSVYFLNYIILQPGEGLFLAPNEPHAYIQGDCMECMACSDNVVRAGLTSKFIDTKTLIEMLTYDDYAIDKMKLNGDVKNQVEKHYTPSSKEFKVRKIELYNEINNVHNLSIDGISIFIVMEGNSRLNNKNLILKKGDVYIVPNGEVLDFEKLGEDNFVMYLVSTNI